MALQIYDAVKIARTQAQQLFEGQTLPHLMVEEVEFDETKQAWLITLGYDSHHKVIKTSKGQGIMSVLGESAITTEDEIPRIYKVFIIDASDGRLISMKMRDV